MPPLPGAVPLLVMPGAPLPEAPEPGRTCDPVVVCRQDRRACLSGMRDPILRQQAVDRLAVDARRPGRLRDVAAVPP